MSVAEAVREAKNPQEALHAIAVALDVLLEGSVPNPNAWGNWGRVQGHAPEDHAPQRANFGSLEHRVTTTDDGAHTEITLPPPSEERRQARRQFETERLHLGDHLGGDTNWNDIYAAGGPLWLYHGNRELFVSYPEDTKARMIEDIIEDSPQEAHEIGRDALKQPCEDGPGSVAMRTAEGNIG